MISLGLVPGAAGPRGNAAAGAAGPICDPGLGARLVLPGAGDLTCEPGLGMRFALPGAAGTRGRVPAVGLLTAVLRLVGVETGAGFSCLS